MVKATRVRHSRHEDCPAHLTHFGTNVRGTNQGFADEDGVGTGGANPLDGCEIMKATLTDDHGAVGSSWEAQGNPFGCVERGDEGAEITVVDADHCGVDGKRDGGFGLVVYLDKDLQSDATGHPKKVGKSFTGNIEVRVAVFKRVV